MTDKNQILELLKKEGNKLTLLRKTLVDLFCSNEKAWSFLEIKDYLDKKGLSLNKTSVYRELNFLLNAGIIKEVNFAERNKRFELANIDHHHHFICINCKKVEHIEISEDYLNKEAMTVSKNLNFDLRYHHLEFYGYCSKCSKLIK
jgi:Fur family transcriptional regulator, ferric uptake regulator